VTESPEGSRTSQLERRCPFRGWQAGLELRKEAASSPLALGRDQNSLARLLHRRYIAPGTLTHQRRDMNTRQIVVAFLMLTALLLGACAPSRPAKSPDDFAGTWTGTMNFTHYPDANEAVVVSIPKGCAVGEVCGEIENTTMDCTWSMQLSSVTADVFWYSLSESTSGDCAAEGEGTLVMREDGTLFREHKTGEFVAVGALYPK
jgi:hypothetical protein